MDADHAAPASKAENQFDSHTSQSKSSDMDNTAPSSAKRKREDDEHGNKGKSKYKQRTFQHGSRKHKSNKREDLGREEYLYVPEIYVSPISAHSNHP